jgi:hypothetical protein
MSLVADLVSLNRRRLDHRALAVDAEDVVGEVSITCSGVRYTTHMASPLFDSSPIAVCVQANDDFLQQIVANVSGYAPSNRITILTHIEGTIDAALDRVTTEFVLYLSERSLLVDNPERIISKLGPNLLFASQPTFNGDFDLLYKYMQLCDHHSHHRFICDNMFIGRTTKAVECFKLARKYASVDYVYTNHYPLISIDHFCEIFVVVPKTPHPSKLFMI